MRKLIYVNALLLVVCFVSCKRDNKVNHIQGKPLILNVADAIENKRLFSLEDISNEVKFIPLDDSCPDALVGNILEMAESEKKYYIVDDTRKPIKIFDKMGKFHSTVGGVGRGHNEYTDVYDIAIDYENEIVYVVSSGGMIISSIIAYDADGRMFARNDSIVVASISFHGNHLILKRNFFNNSTIPGDTVTVVEAFSPDLHFTGDINASYKGSARVPIKRQDGGYSAIILPHVFSDNGHSILIKEARCDTVFQYMDDVTLNPVYVLEMGKYLPPEELDVQQSDQLNRHSWGRIMDKLLWISNIYDVERYIVVATNKGYAIFDKYDSLGGFSTIGGRDGKSGLFIDGIHLSPCYVHNNRLVGYMQAIDIVDNADVIANPELKTIAAAMKEDDNPVIVIAKLKK